MSETKSYLFYVLDTTARPALLSELLGACRLEVWRPTTWAIRPPGVTMLPFAVWWIFHWLRVFANPGYSVIVVYAGDQLIHRTGVFPRILSLSVHGPARSPDWRCLDGTYPSREGFGRRCIGCGNSLR